MGSPPARKGLLLSKKNRKKCWKTLKNKLRVRLYPPENQIIIYVLCSLHFVSPKIQISPTSQVNTEDINGKAMVSCFKHVRTWPSTFNESNNIIKKNPLLRL